MIGFTTIIDQGELEKEVKKYNDEGYHVSYLDLCRGVWVASFQKEQRMQFSNESIERARRLEFETPTPPEIPANLLCKKCFLERENLDAELCNSCQGKL